MSEILLALLLALILSGILLLQAQILRSGSRLLPDDQEQFAILQLRDMICLSSSVQVNEGALILEENGRTERIEQDRNRLVKRPGYEILMENLESCRFESKQDRIYLIYHRSGKMRTFQVG